MIDFSVITATYNAERTVAACLESVQKNKLEHTEHIVVDGASPDRTVDVVKRFSNVVCISEKDNGIYDAMNKGIRNSRNEILSFLNADDYYLDGTLALVRKTFEKHPESDIVHGNILVNGKVFKPANGLASFGGARIFHPAAFIRRSLFDKLGMYDDKYRICADLDFFLRAKEAGAKFTYIDQPLTDFALDGLSTSARSKTALEVRMILLNHGYSRSFAYGYYYAMKLRTVLASLKGKRK
ncbi:MAG: glycosyltransferase [Lentisphaeria bacterium]|nr:glycosyltransferase [Lentisphaeria bacterium]